MRTFALRCSVILSVLAALAAPALAEKVRLAPRLANGHAGTFAITTETRQTASEVGKPDKSIVYRLDARIRFEMKDAGPDTATVTATYERLAITLDSPGMKSEFDSDWPASRDGESMFGPAVRSAVGKSLRATVSATGEIGEIMGLDEIAPPGPEGENVRQLLNPTGLRELLSTIYGVRPGSPETEPGESWTDVSELPNLLGVTRLTETRTLTKADGGFASIKIEGKGELERKQGEGVTPGAQFVSLKSATIAGDAQWNIGAGRMERLSHTLTMEVLDEDPVRQGKSLTQTVVTRTQIDAAK